MTAARGGVRALLRIGSDARVACDIIRGGDAPRNPAHPRRRKSRARTGRRVGR
jgi:hypothetical protein